MGRGITIAVAGKGGVGKTNICALLIRMLSKSGSVLAIDADPDSNLPQALGVVVGRTVGEIRETILNAPADSEIAKGKQEFLRSALIETIEEFDEFDLVVMGRSEGPGCYCAINSTIQHIIDSRADSYDFTVVDCEAGLEHLSRRTARDVDIMLVVTEPTKNGIMTAKNVRELSEELHIDFGTLMIVANKVTPAAKPFLDRMAQEVGLEISAYIPYDESIARLDLLGEPIKNLNHDSIASTAIGTVYDKILTCVESSDEV